MIPGPGKGTIYFASDLHLGVPNDERSSARERRFIEWIEQCRPDMQELYLVGDVFDFWFEYKKAVPKGFVRLQAKIAELTDSGIPVHYFIGNHDMWINDYFEKELGVQMHFAPIQREYGGKKFFIGHGDGLGPGDYGYKFIKKVFRNPFFQWLFRWVHPDIGISVAQFWSRTSRYHTGREIKEEFLGEEKEWLAQYCRRQLEREHFDYFIFGHRHLPLDLKVGANSRYVNLGDWISYYTYASFDGTDLQLHTHSADGEQPA